MTFVVSFVLVLCAAKLSRERAVGRREGDRFGAASLNSQEREVSGGGLRRWFEAVTHPLQIVAIARAAADVTEWRSD